MQMKGRLMDANAHWKNMKGKNEDKLKDNERKMTANACKMKGTNMK